MPLCGVLFIMDARILLPAEHLFWGLDQNNISPFEIYELANSMSYCICCGITFNPIEADKHSRLLKHFTTTAFFESLASVCLG